VRLHPEAPLVALLADPSSERFSVTR